MPGSNVAGHETARLGGAAMLVAAAAYGIATAVSVAALDRVRAADLVAVELTGAAVLLLVVGGLRGTLRRQGAGRSFAIGALMPGLAFVLGDLGLSRTSASAGSLLLASELPLTVLLSMLFLREKLRGRGLVALFLGLTGGGVVALGTGGADGTATTLGNVLVVASVSASAVFVILTRTYNGADGLSASTWQTVGAAVCTSPFVLIGWSHGGSSLPTAGAEGWMLCLGVLGTTAIGSVAFNWGISRVPAVTASQLLNLTPLVGLVAAVVLLGEDPSLPQYVGGVLVLAATVILVRTVEGDGEPEPDGIVEPPWPALDASVEGAPGNAA
jgi:drug/metabolite transporter (DMT)-like permease